MEALMTALTIAALLAVVALLGLGLVQAWRRVMRIDGPLPFFQMLSRRGLSVDRVMAQRGPDQTALAVRRCALCASGEECRQRAATGAPLPEDCPNSGLFAQLSSPSV